jgi:CHRD domain/PEP-CTERM motif
MRKCTRLAVLAGGLVGLLCVRGAYATDTTINVHLSNAAENPPTNPTASGGGARPASFGDAVFLVHTDPNPALQFVTMDVTINNIDVTGSQTPADTNDNLANAHIHASPTATATNNVGVVWGFVGSPFNDNNPNDIVFTPFAAPGVGGTWHGKWDPPEGNSTTLAAQINNLLTFHAYINFHTSQFGGGEIRGMIPEPSSGLLLLGTGLVGLGRRGPRRA